MTETRTPTEPTYFLDHQSPEVREFVDRALPDRNASPREMAVRLHDAVRDGIRYEVYDADLTREGVRASGVLKRGQGFCVHKSIVYAAAARSVGIPTRLVYGDVRNHLASERLLELMGGDLFTFHALVSVRIDGAWIRATPVFNTLLCRLYGIRPLEFDGRDDSYYHPFDEQGRRHMEFVRWRGEYDDFPYDTVVGGIAANHPKLVGPELVTAQGSLADDARRERGE
ncbi:MULTISPECIES: transglutaminase-like domain-containing protein [Nocardiopsis]|uniref:Transglutaminase-like domain-containing protein n=2 Tax=Nocardiopsis alba TaxID=53437 RepID=A0A7K2IYB9_9ACTN|nr:MULTISPECIES: transglutaminase-like domain-containing protein [Nocardiopsis]AFR06498.1 transglutaminase-like superfamily protein [Nocardiopsis alba ATCC BAA-2165]MEC3891719.1 transglutaminase-like domain-containing protein [Nocardiopsis sp. LDBS1602]MYR34943.1 transglutaminase-like superfamily protein [Nocardiopsis alba]